MSDDATSAQVFKWLADPLPAEVQRFIERVARTESVRHIAVMPDVHLAGEFCVGMAVATRGVILPQAVGGDIGCGMAAIAFDANADCIGEVAAAEAVLSGLGRAVPANRHAHPPPLPDSLAQLPLSTPGLANLARRDGRVQLGTLGRGNHFVELQADEEDRLWLMVHTGSRGMGQAITELHTGRCLTTPTRLQYLDAGDDAGHAYLADAQWAGRYADENRMRIVDAVVTLLSEVLGVEALRETLITCDHNHVREEEHAGERVFVHRKGAMPAGADVAGVVPGSMGSASFHVAGRGCADALQSSAHGAGRAMDRTTARRSIGVGELHRQLRGVWFDPRKAAALRDEAPAAYKDITRVMRAQRDLVRITRRLRPVLSYKGV